MLGNKLNTILQTGSLRARLFRGGAWLSVGSFGEQGLRFIRNVILARLLAPEAFGTMAIVLSVCQLIDAITGVGVRESVIHNPKGSDRGFLNVAWWVAVARYFVLAIIVAVAAPLAADFYQNPQLSGLLLVAAAGVFLRGLISPGIHAANKEMKFRAVVLTQHGGGALGILCTILLAILMPGVWALVLGFVAEALFRSLISFWVSPFVPELRLNGDHLRSLMGYARGMAGLSLLTLIYSQAGIFVAGKLRPAEELGLFAVASSLAGAPSMVAGLLLRSLLMPVFAQSQTDRSRLNRALERFTEIVAPATFSLLVVVAIFGASILGFVYGRQYEVMSLPFVLLLLNSTLSITWDIPISSVLLAIGQPAVQRRITLMRALLTAALIYPAVVNFGVTGIAWVTAACGATTVVYQLWQVRTLIGFNLGLHFKTILKAGGLGICLGAGVLCLRHYVGAWSSGPGALLFLLAGGGALYPVVVWVLSLRRRLIGVVAS